MQLHAFGRTAAIDEMETQAARLARVHRAKGVQPAGALMVSCLDRGEQLYGEEGVETACEPRELLSLGFLRRRQVAKPRFSLGAGRWRTRGHRTACWCRRLASSRAARLGRSATARTRTVTSRASRCSGRGRPDQQGCDPGVATAQGSVLRARHSQAATRKSQGQMPLAQHKRRLDDDEPTRSEKAKTCVFAVIKIRIPESTLYESSGISRRNNRALSNTV